MERDPEAVLSKVFRGKFVEALKEAFAAAAHILDYIQWYMNSKEPVAVTCKVGMPIEDMKVRLSYQNFSAESKGHELDAITDSQGRAYFPTQRTSASIARYIVYSAWSATTGVHASFGRHANVFTFGQGRDGSATTSDVITDWTGAPQEMKSRIVATQRPRLEH